RHKGIHLVEAGVSGGIWGLEVGFCLMVGGDEEPVKTLEPVLTALAPEAGYAHVGPAGAGHFVKMIHNGIEYGLMQSYAEGFEIMEHSEYELDLTEIAGIWRNGSVVRSWLLELLHAAFEHHGGDLNDIAPYVEDSGEGRWTINEAINENVPAPVIAASLFARFASRDDVQFREDMKEAVKKYGRDEFRDDVWEKLAEGMRWVTADFADEGGEDRIIEALNELDETRGTRGNRVYYLAVPPSAFEMIVEAMGKRRSTEGWTRLIVEKPFGYDLHSARELNALLTRYFEEREIFRIDHYLGKETVQNVLA